MAPSSRQLREERRRRACGRAEKDGAVRRPRNERRCVEHAAARRTAARRAAGRAEDALSAGCRAKNPSGACFGRQSTSCRHRGWLGDFIAMVPISFKLRQICLPILIYRVLRNSRINRAKQFTSLSVLISNVQLSDSRWQRVEKTCKSADTKPVGRGFGSGFVPVGEGAGTNSNPTGIC